MTASVKRMRFGVFDDIVDATHVKISRFAVVSDSWQLAVFRQSRGQERSNDVQWCVTQRRGRARVLGIGATERDGAESLVF